MHNLATLDADGMFDGGWLLPLGQEEFAASVTAAYRELPAGGFETLAAIPTRSRPHAIERRRTIVYLETIPPGG